MDRLWVGFNRSREGERGREVWAQTIPGLPKLISKEIEQVYALLLTVSRRHIRYLLQDEAVDVCRVARKESAKSGVVVPEEEKMFSKRGK